MSLLNSTTCSEQKNTALFHLTGTSPSLQQGCQCRVFQKTAVPGSTATMQCDVIWQDTALVNHIQQANIPGRLLCNVYTVFLLFTLIELIVNVITLKSCLWQLHTFVQCLGVWYAFKRINFLLYTFVLYSWGNTVTMNVLILTFKCCSLLHYITLHSHNTKPSALLTCNFSSPNNNKLG